MIKSITNRNASTQYSSHIQLLTNANHDTIPMSNKEQLYYYLDDLEVYNASKIQIIFHVDLS